MENRGNGQHKRPLRGIHREFENFTKTQGILNAQVVNSLILNIKGIGYLPEFFTIFSKELNISAKSHLHIIGTVIICICTEKKQGKHREFQVSFSNCEC